ncbi:MAG: YggS family pyridoxal phosphate-dependent enzyme [Betaproteobacteria bacterium]|nr:YggS family pyridoxal phosphate-dependent enzyme [Betaproteobacteria bacterium]
MSAVTAGLQAVRARIAAAAAACGRDPREITLLAVAKGHPADALREAYRAGQRAFGESYAQEGAAHAAASADLAVEWHFIGPLQSNKTRGIAEHYAWVHSIDRLKIAERLSAARPEGLAPLNVCVQVNVGAETTKGGVPPEEAAALAAQVARLPRLKVRGLMTIPKPSADVTEQRHQFAVLRELLAALNARGLALDTLSMGMSDDLEAAIAEGSTLVRVGSAIFGTRRPKP